MRVPADETWGSGQWSCCFSYDGAVNVMGDAFETKFVKGELSAPKGEWNDRPSARG